MSNQTDITKSKPALLESFNTLLPIASFNDVDQQTVLN